MSATGETRATVGKPTPPGMTAIGGRPATVINSGAKNASNNKNASNSNDASKSSDAKKKQ